MKIVGIGGLPRSGKDTLAEMFMDAGYFGVSFGDIVRGFSMERHKDAKDPISVANMTETSNWLRQTRGSDVILQEALGKYEKASKNQTYVGMVLYSVRAPVEVDWILGHGGELVWVEASDTVRHGRAMRHLREGEAKVDLAEFQRQEALQWQPQEGIPAEVQMNISHVQSKATKTIENNGEDKEAFLAEAKKLVSDSTDAENQPDFTNAK